MLKLLKELATDATKRAAYAQDPEEFLESYDLTQYEKHLLIERNASAIEGYLRNPVVPNEGMYAAATVIAVQAVIVIIAGDDFERSSVTRAQEFDSYWSRVDQRARQLGA